MVVSSRNLIGSGSCTGIGRCTQRPVAGSQASAVQELPSSQFTGTCRHAPVCGTHSSSVHRLPSSQLSGEPWHTIPPVGVCTHLSPCVQALPLAGSQESAVHWFPSSQFTGTCSLWPVLG